MKVKYLLRSIRVMLMPRPVFLHCRHHPLDVNNFIKLPLCGVISPPRSISDERHDDESSKLEPRRCRLKQAQFLNIFPIYFYNVSQLYSLLLFSLFGDPDTIFFSVRLIFLVLCTEPIQLIATASHFFWIINTQ